MLDKVTWSESRSYRTGSKYEPFQFYLDGLCNSTSLDLLLGYFSSSAINLLSLGFATFLNRGGTLRMIINNVLSKNDKDAIKRGVDGETGSFIINLSNIKELKDSLDEYGTHFFNCLAWLIANERIQVRIIKPKNGRGISHYKSGVFSDSLQAVGFKASCNFTSFGLVENLEELDAFLNWENSHSSIRINEQNEYFNSIVNGANIEVEYLAIEDTLTAIKSEFGSPQLNELLETEKELLARKTKVLSNENVKKSIDRALTNIEKITDEPKFPYGSGPRKYQMQAYANWVENERKGIFAMATGTGKTITSLNCILEEYKLNGFYRFIVLVPTISLAKQWEDEIVLNFNFNEITICSSQNNLWEDDVRKFGKCVRMGKDVNFCIVLTYATFRGSRFQNALNDLFKNGFDKMTIIADEAHTFGSNKLLALLPHGIPNRIGLSATPERQFDVLGEQQICKYFNSNPPDYTFSYNMKKAIRDKVLCKYFYHPVFVELEPNELLEYRAITTKLNKFLDADTGRYKDDPYVNMLLIQRKNIIHKANQKSNCLISIIRNIGKEKFKYAFIYVPEGYDTDYEQNDIDISDAEDDSIIDSYTKLIYATYQLKLKKFTGETINRNEILKQFSEGKLDALLAMKCLDEGIDIPQTKYAIFCSSTGNPRQYIQRRGRVLRYHGEKEFAYIYDMIVKPSLEATCTDVIQRRLEKNIFKAELARLINFAVLAENKLEVLRSLEEFCYSLELDIYEMANIEEQKYK